MKVFISWSGDYSKAIAKALHEWLPSVLQSIDPYMSAENIDKGDRWSENVAKQLEGTDYGIVCVTPDNLRAPWIMFESGALSKSLQKGRVCPITFGLSPSDFAGSPLLQFQQTTFGRQDMLKLIHSLNKAATENECIEERTLDTVFNRSWEDLNSEIKTIETSQENFDVPENKKIIKEIFEEEIVKSIQEILSNSRSQLNLLKSPSEILPKSYFTKILREATDVTIAVPRSFPEWIHIDDAIASLENIVDLYKRKNYLESWSRSRKIELFDQLSNDCKHQFRS